MLTEREARRNIKLNFDTNRLDWEQIVVDQYGLEYDRTIEREISEVLVEDLDGNEIEYQPGDA